MLAETEPCIDVTGVSVPALFALLSEVFDELFADIYTVRFRLQNWDTGNINIPHKNGKFNQNSTVIYRKKTDKVEENDKMIKLKKTIKSRKD